MIPLFCAQTVNAEFDLITPMQRVVDSHWYVLGKETESFEQEFAAYVGVAHCMAVCPVRLEKQLQAMQAAEQPLPKAVKTFFISDVCFQ